MYFKDLQLLVKSKLDIEITPVFLKERKFVAISLLRAGHLLIYSQKSCTNTVIFTLRERNRLFSATFDHKSEGTC